MKIQDINHTIKEEINQHDLDNNHDFFKVKGESGPSQEFKKRMHNKVQEWIEDEKRTNSKKRKSLLSMIHIFKITSIPVIALGVFILGFNYYNNLPPTQETQYAQENTGRKGFKSKIAEQITRNVQPTNQKTKQIAFLNHSQVKSTQNVTPTRFNRTVGQQFIN